MYSTFPPELVLLVKLLFFPALCFIFFVVPLVLYNIFKKKEK